MEVLARIRAGGREIEYGLVTTKQERAAVLAQRFRVFERKGYYRPGLSVDRDLHDEKAIHLLALLRDPSLGDLLLGSARLIFGEPDAGFRFPTEMAFGFEPPAAMRDIATEQRIEVGRVIAEAVHGVVIGGLLTPLGLVQAVAEYASPRGARCGLLMIKSRFFRALLGAGLRLHEIKPAQLVYPSDGPVSGYFYKHPDPVIPAYWLADEIGPSVERAIARHQGAGD